MLYNSIEDKYIKANIQGHYKFRNAAELKVVLGIDIPKIKGFEKLSDDDKILAEQLICFYVNGWGLSAREKIKPASIIRQKGKFKLIFKDKEYSYLYDDGSVG